MVVNGTVEGKINQEEKTMEVGDIIKLYKEEKDAINKLKKEEEDAARRSRRPMILIEVIMTSLTSMVSSLWLTLPSTVLLTIKPYCINVLRHVKRIKT